MTIEIANRLANLRREHGYSQETLAEKLGISRQAVSKWERAESAPDLDNLMQLAELYHVSLDDLLRPSSEKGTEESSEDPDEAEAQETEENGTFVHIGLDGIHVEDGKDRVHVGWKGIHVEEGISSDTTSSSDGHSVHVDQNGVFVDGKQYDKKGHLFRSGSENVTGITAILVTAVYLFLGFYAQGWHPWWILFFLIPLPETLICAIRKRKPSCFAFPVLVLFVFFLLGCCWGQWIAGTVLFLLIPVYYMIFR